MSEENGHYEELLLQAHADQSGITDQVTELMRSVLRGISAGQPGSAAGGILEKLDFISKLVARCEAFDEHQAVSDAIRSFSNQDNPSPLDEAYFDISIAGLRWLAESSARDGFAQARAAKCRSELLRSVLTLVELRERGGRP